MPKYRLTQEKVENANQFYLTYNDGITFNVQNAYNCLGNGMVMATKFLWEVECVGD
ncbi:hypothetical protein [Coleofasciculus sp. E1-EBD-02]|uniref:hypothetical protein n=1 Tax=Coleofasciculus sp. E1-EBD-02 TaxID=3068481 RepID=UPI0032FF969E